jgi:hypothetical protein
MRLALVLSLAAATACASSGASSDVGGVPHAQTISIGGGGSGAGRESMGMGGGAAASGPTSHVVDAASDRVFRILPAVFDSIGAPVTRIDPALKVMGNEGFKIRQRLGKTALSRYIDCGQAQIGPNADSYEVFMVLLVQIKPATTATSSSVVTTFQTQARPLTFSQGYSACSSKGSLEAKIVELVKAQLK